MARAAPASPRSLFKPRLDALAWLGEVPGTHRSVTVRPWASGAWFGKTVAKNVVNNVATPNYWLPTSQETGTRSKNCSTVTTDSCTGLPG